MKQKATINNPFHRHHSAPGGRKKVQQKVGVSDTVKVNRFAKGTQIPVMEVSEPDENEIDITYPLLVAICVIAALVDYFLK